MLDTSPIAFMFIVGAATALFIADVILTVRKRKAMIGYERTVMESVATAKALYEAQAKAFAPYIDKLENTMTRKFTPPTEFSAEYVDDEGCKVVLLAKGVGTYPFVGQVYHKGTGLCAEAYALGGAAFYVDNKRIYDLPKKHVSWANEYPDRIGGWFYTTKSVADRKADKNRIGITKRVQREGELPVYTTEKV